MDSQWIPLLEYSSKYGISISTLRRRIRFEQIPFRLESGKYFLQDQSWGSSGEFMPHSRSIRTTSFQLSNEKITEEKETKKSSLIASLEWKKSFEKFLLSQQERLMEKDQKILKQQDEISDLKTLLALLEKENRDLKSILHQEKELADWLEEPKKVSTEKHFEELDYEAIETESFSPTP